MTMTNEEITTTREAIASELETLAREVRESATITGAIADRSARIAAGSLGLVPCASVREWRFTIAGCQYMLRVDHFAADGAP